MKRSLWALVAVAVGIGWAVSPAVAGAAPEQTQPGGSPESEIGVTADTIRIAVIADVDNPVQPGLFQGTVNGVQAFAKYINSHGKLAGRNVQVDFIDSHLSADEARNARDPGVPGGLRDGRHQRAVLQQRRSRWSSASTRRAR